MIKENLLPDLKNDNYDGYFKTKRVGYLTREEHRNHFKKRLYERYALSITDEEYENYCAKDYIRKNFLYKFRKGQNKKIGIIKIKDIDVLTLYKADQGLFATAYPPEAMHDEKQAFKACFSTKTTAIVKLLLLLYNRALYEIYEMKYPKFENNKEAAEWIKKNCFFTYLGMRRYFTPNKEPLKMFDLFGYISRALRGEISDLCFGIVKKDAMLSVTTRDFKKELNI